MKALSRLCLCTCNTLPFHRRYRSYVPVSLSAVTKHLLEPSFETKEDKPLLNLINIRLRSYDFATLEHFQSYVHHIAKTMGLEIANNWAVPAETTKVSVYRPRTSVVSHEYELAMYERFVQVRNIPGPIFSILSDVIYSNLPEGVSLTLKEHEPPDEMAQYIPDIEIHAMEKELAEVTVRLETERQKVN